jgi:hypothetical protein
MFKSLTLKKRLVLKLSIKQFRIIFILWTIWGAWAGSALIFGVIGWILRYGIISILQSPATLLITLLCILMPINIILFYMANFRHKANYDLSLRWISVSIIPLYIFTVFSIGAKFDISTIGHHTFFILLHIIVAWKQESYFNYLRSKTPPS